MFKKFISLIGITTTLALLVPATVVAADLELESIIQTVELSVAGSTPETFQPSNNQELATAVTFNPDLAQELSNSTGSVVVTTKANPNVVLKTLVSWNAEALPAQVPNWDGKSIDNNAGAQAICGNAGAACPNGDYVLKVHTEYASGANTFFDDDSADFKIGAQSSITIDTFTATVSSGGPSFDPSPSGNNADLNIEYEINQEVDNVNTEIKDPNDDLVKSFNSNLQSNTLTWDGIFSGKLVLPGVYSVKLTASKSGEQSVDQTMEVTVEYGNANKGDILDLLVNPSAFDPDVEDTTIEFTNTKEAEITLTIEKANGDFVDGFNDFSSTSYSSNSKHVEIWDGEDTFGNKVGIATYKAVVVSRNDFGVVVKKADIAVNNSGGSVSSSNAHVAGIDLNPSKTFEPEKDDELEIEWDVKVDLDELKIFAIRGSQKIEIYSEDDVEKENNLNVTWDGTDDDEYADKGSWKIQFESRKAGTSLIAAKTITIDYEKPEVSELEVSKKEFDNDEDEFTYVYFKIKDDANVDIRVLEGGSEQDDVIEDMDVEGGKWYAVEWDGGSFDYEDDLNLLLVAKNRVNDKVFDSKKISIDLKENDVSGDRANILRDSIDPVISNGVESLNLRYYIDDEADVKVTIHKGLSSSGSTVTTLVNEDDQEQGEHEVEWQPLNVNGAKILGDGFYTYKVIATKSGSDTETGVFLVTSDSGDIDGSAGSSGSSSSSNNNSGNTNPNVTVDGDTVTTGGNDNSGSGSNGSSFKDVPENHAYAKAIEWVADEGIFQGYGDGTFKPNQPISRVEILKVILLALGVNVQNPPAGDKLGFSDVIVGDWYMPFVFTAKNLGVFNGDGGGLKAITTARPADTVNRAEALKMVFETLSKQGGAQVSNCSQPYNDVKAGDWFYNYVCGAKQYELFDTVSGNFVPGAHSTRGEMAELFYRLYLSGLI